MVKSKSNRKRAIQTLTRTGEVSITKEVCRQAQALHPAASEEQRARLATLPKRIISVEYKEVTDEMLRK